MQNLHKSSLVICALFAALSARAQSVDSAPSTGLLGQRYVEADAALIDPHGASGTAWKGGVGANMPFQSNLDFGLGLSQSGGNTSLSTVKNIELRERQTEFAASATAYMSSGRAKPFLTGGLGYQTNRNDIRYLGTSAGKSNDDRVIWNLAVGAEIPVASVTLTPKVAYRGDFNGCRSGAMVYGAEVSSWLTKSVGLFAGLAYVDPTHDSVRTYKGTGQSVSSSALLDPLTQSLSGSNGDVVVYDPKAGGVQSWVCSLGMRYRF